MADAAIFRIEQGVLGFALVDPVAVGYQTWWLAPGGKDVKAVTLADYDVSSQSWTCQVSSGALTASPDTTTEDIAATFCAPGKTVPTPGETSYALDVEYYQDPHVRLGLSRFLFENDTKESYFVLGLNSMDPPTAIGRVRVQSGAIGGAARAALTATLSLPLSMRPQIEFGKLTDSDAVPASVIPASGATAGIPGTWTPTGSNPPATVAALQAGTPVTVTASPATTWTIGQYVQTLTAGVPGQAHWNGTAWVSGPKP